MRRPASQATWNVRRVIRWSAVVSALVFESLATTVSFAQPGAPVDAQPANRAESPPDARLDGARRHFERGVAHYDRGQWQAALVEFLRSRELAPTRANTKNAAICLRRVGRFDEALTLFEALLREFPDLPVADRELARREIEELRSSVGAVEIRDAPPGAQVSIDGLDRGATPLPSPITLSVGSHAVRVVKDGFLPFEASVDIAFGRTQVVRAKLLALTRAGQLHVSEKNGKRVEVLIDGAPVGSAPWNGALAPGVHVVSLRGEGTLGTPPKPITIQVGNAHTVELEAVSLPSWLDVAVEPDSAEIRIDDVLVGRGSWMGRLAAGEHRMLVSLAGYQPFSRTLGLNAGQRERVRAVLEPSASAARILVELDAGIPVGLLWGGDLADACVAPCSSSLARGIYAQAHVAYRFSNGVGVGIHAGYLRLEKTFTHRPETLDPAGEVLQSGTADDDLRILGLLVGGEVDYAVGRTWVLTLRVGAGALIAAASDVREGQFEDSAGVRYTTGWEQTRPATYFYLAPELRVGYPLGKHAEVSLGVRLLVLAGLPPPAWDREEGFTRAGADGAGYFPAADLTGSTMLVALPGVALRYAF